MYDARGEDRPEGGPGRWDGVRRLGALGERLGDDATVASLAALAAVAVALCGYLAYQQLRPSARPPVEDLLPRVQPAPTTTTTTTAPLLLVHVVGAVREPGVRQLPAGARILDALAAAGGATEDADIARLNLAAPLTDGAQVRVPVRGEDVTGPLVVAPAGPAAAGGGGGGSAGGEPVPLNSATAAELEALPGIGPATAAAIVAWREANGPFTAVDQLLDVRGIGPAKFEAIRDLVVVG